MFETSGVWEFGVFWLITCECQAIIVELLDILNNLKISRQYVHTYIASANFSSSNKCF